MFCAAVLILLAWCASAQPAGMVGTLQWYANRAKSGGQTSYAFGPDEGKFDYTPKLEEIVKSYLLVDGVVESTFVYALNNSTHIETWYKIRVLSRGQEPSIIMPASAKMKMAIPEQLGIFDSDEVALCEFGGSAVIDGVSLTARGEPPLIMGKRYLFFLDSTAVSNAYTNGSVTRPVLVDENGTIQHPSKKTTYLRSIDGFRDLDELKRYVRQVVQQH